MLENSNKTTADWPDDEAQRPPPPVPPDCSLRCYYYIPLPVALIRDSPWWLTASAAAQAAQLHLMVAAWHQIPAASLPDDNRILAKLGRISSKVTRCLNEIKSEWIRCSDGRLYHSELAAIALESWEKRQSQVERTAAARRAKAAAKISVTSDVTGSNEREEGEEGEDTEREKGGHRLPGDWQPNPAERDYAESLGLNPSDTADDFRSYWHTKPGGSALKLDWSDAWRHWCRRDRNNSNGGY